MDSDLEELNTYKCSSSRASPDSIADVISYLKNVDEASHQEVEKGIELKL
jgi:predicted transcriptional regulator